LGEGEVSRMEKLVLLCLIVGVIGALAELSAVARARK
jgi:hypothetical protein